MGEGKYFTYWKSFIWSSSNQVTVDNLADNLLVTFGTDKIEIRVKATAGELDDFNLDEVKASVDLKDMEVGSYQIPVTVKLPKGI